MGRRPEHPDLLIAVAVAYVYLTPDPTWVHRTHTFIAATNGV